MTGRSVTQKKGRKNLPNMGPVSTIWLRAIGVETLEDLRSMGIEEAFRRLIEYGFTANALMLYAMEGARMGTHWNAISDARKAELRELARHIRKR